MHFWKIVFIIRLEALTVLGLSWMVGGSCKSPSEQIVERCDIIPQLFSSDVVHQEGSFISSSVRADVSDSKTLFSSVVVFFFLMFKKSLFIFETETEC